MLKYRIQYLLDSYKEEGKMKKEYKQMFRKLIETSGMDAGQLYKARNWKIEDRNTLTSDNLIKIAFAFGVKVDALLNKPKQFQLQTRKESVAA